MVSLLLTLEQEQEGLSVNWGKKKKDVKSNMKMNTKIIEVRIKDSKLCCYTKMIIQSCVLKNNPSVVAV